MLCTTQGRRVIAKIQVCPHEFSTESYLLPDASWKLIALFLVLPVVISVIGVIAYVLIMLRGLEKEAIYKVVETNEVYGGDELMYVGLYIGELLGDYQSRVWTIEKI